MKKPTMKVTTEANKLHTLFHRNILEGFFFSVRPSNGSKAGFCPTYSGRLVTDLMEVMDVRDPLSPNTDKVDNPESTL